MSLYMYKRKRKKKTNSLQKKVKNKDKIKNANESFQLAIFQVVINKKKIPNTFVILVFLRLQCITGLFCKYA